MPWGTLEAEEVLSGLHSLVVASANIKERRERNADSKQAEIKQAEIKQAEIKQAEIKQAEIKQAEIKQAERDTLPGR
ncbi:hypothetical protein Q4551_03815 [Oceanobacter sp. 5_MG-2023]|uniref:hypothetical protein n=1 Tax=Oceanobacter sp. 5_MG-2023 TaxID=3062645 RepID=UPI0026E3BD61|nr:hypothetical protein [Oceanobacter sp. 5_MG-2023]MDO6681405.1 hypothetical protein [Oceanobacter sp. 5_MG-2023]